MLYKKSKEHSLSEELFKNPTPEYRGSPFWGWNCELDKEELFRQLGILKEMGFGGVHIHSRTGLETEYLGEKFMNMVSECCDKAESCNMFLSLYDEDRWPSGAAGGIVTDDKRYRQRFIVMRTAPMEATEDYDYAYENAETYYIAEFNVVLDKCGRLVSYQRTKEPPKENETKWYVYSETQAPDSWFNNRTYLDTLSKKAADKFIEVTYDGYKKAVGNYFGGLIQSIFTDEPQFARKGNLSFAAAAEDVKMPWTMEFDKLFEERYGFRITDRLPELFWELADGNVSKTRYLYHDFSTELFCEAFMYNCGKWCERNGIDLTGHMLCEESLYSQASTIGEAMRAYKHFGIPGIDILCDSHEYTTAKQAQSAVHQYAREGMMSELYGVTGWDFDFRRHKAQGDWQAALGVTLRVLSVSWVSMKGDAKRDYPTSVNYQSSWYKEYSYIENHFARVCTAMTRGNPIVKVGVIHPIETYWLRFGPNDSTGEERKTMDDQFHMLAEWLLRGTIDFDYICESLLPEQAGEIGNTLSVGAMKYSAVIVAGCETLRSTTVNILKRFADAGGKIIFVGKPPKYMDAVLSDEPKLLYEKCTHADYTKSSILNSLSAERAVEVRETDGNLCDRMCYQLREDNDCLWLFLAHMHYNYESMFETGSENLADCKMRKITVKGTYEPLVYDTLSGEIKEIDFETVNGNTSFYYPFYSNDSLLVKLTRTAKTKRTVKRKPTEPLSVQYITEPIDYKLSEPNVIVFDIAQYHVDDEPFREREEIRKIQKIVKDELHLPNDRTQPYAIKDIKSGHTVTLKYTFNSEIELKGTKLALEDAEKSKITFNGETVKISIDGYFTDKSIKTVSLPAILKGENILEITIPIDNRSSIEACFLLGNFGVKLKGIEKTVTSPEKMLGFGDVGMQGMPFYGANIEYSMNIEAPCDCDAVIAVRNYRGMVMRASLDEKDLGIIAFSPYEIKANGLTKGRHKLRITLYGSRNNCFGPLHMADDKLRWVGPEAWKFMYDGKARWKYEYNLSPLGILAGPEIRYYKNAPTNK